MTKATVIIGAALITIIFMLTGSFGGDINSVVLHKKNNIIGATVSNMKGEKLGAISDLAFDKDTGNIAYVILSYTGMTGRGEKLIPVPLDALRFISEKNAYLNISKEKLASASSIEKAILSEMKDQQWNIDTQQFYSIIFRQE